MEKNLLSKLDPKGKEHQRKKVLRLFFSWNSRQEKHSSTSKFWDWVRNLSPDNLNSPERFKSMSYEFLDKLISKKTFRECIVYWIDKVYMPSLTKSSEDEHAKYFLQFVISSISVKQNIEISKQQYLNEFPAVPMANLDVSSSFDVPSAPGVYIEYKCMKTTCVTNKIKKYGYIGIDIQVDLTSSIETAECSICTGTIVLISIGLISCKYFLTGLVNGEPFEGFKDITNYYTTLDEIHFYQWEEVSLKVVSLQQEEKEYLNNIIFSNFNDPTVPKKKYCKRKSAENIIEVGTGVDIKTVVFGLEKEIRELDSQIYDLVADNYKNSKLIKELEMQVAESAER